MCNIYTPALVCYSLWPALVRVKLSKSVIKHFKSKRPTKVEHNEGFSGVYFAFDFSYITPKPVVGFWKSENKCVFSSIRFERFFSPSCEGYFFSVLRTDKVECESLLEIWQLLLLLCLTLGNTNDRQLKSVSARPWPGESELWQTQHILLVF